MANAAWLLSDRPSKYRIADLRKSQKFIEFFGKFAHLRFGIGLAKQIESFLLFFIQVPESLVRVSSLKYRANKTTNIAPIAAGINQIGCQAWILP